VTVSLLTALERFLLPNACVACEAVVEPHRPDALVCGTCQARLRRLPAGGCDRCQQPLPPVGPCRFCADWPETLDSVQSACWLAGPAPAMVHHLKYQGYHALAADLAQPIVRVVPRPAHGVLVPIPVSARRRRERGYNQAGVLARQLGNQWGLPVHEAILVRATDRGSQTALTPAERMENMRGVFGAVSPKGHAAERPGMRVILIDDVLTTGATLGAAATALTRAGWKRVAAVTFARALPFELRAIDPGNSLYN